MPRGYADTRACPDCKHGCTSEWNYCPWSGENLHPQKRPRVDLIQTLNPVSKRYVLIDRSQGRILRYHPKKNTPYKGVPLATSKSSDIIKPEEQ
jgi:hypothetical protein